MKKLNFLVIGRRFWVNSTLLTHLTAENTGGYNSFDYAIAAYLSTLCLTAITYFMYQLLHAGPVQVRYENGSLRSLSLGQDEVVRMLYFAIRDRHWQTSQVTLTNEVIDQTDNWFRVSYNWQTSDPGIRMSGQVTISGEPDGTISFDFYGKALHSFLKNRIGICALHPPDDVVGQPCQVDSPAGSLTTGLFPTFISPYQPFRNIRTLRWQPISGHDLQLDFTGDVFEMEDQRNWTDASFKTYSTPLDIPFPATVSPGDEVRQRVVFTVIEKATIPPGSTPEQADKPAVTGQTEQPLVWPRIGVGQRSDGQPLTEAEAVRLRALNLAHLRADVFLNRQDWPVRLAQAAADARLLAVPLELALFAGERSTDEWTALLDFIDQTGVVIHSVLLFDAVTRITPDTLLQRVVPLLRKTWPAALIGGGTDGSFVDVNRNRFAYDAVDFVVYSINPQVHAFDDLTLLENIAGQRATVETARHLTGGKAVHISPVTLLPRTTTAELWASALLPDPRHSTKFGAVWTRQSVLTLAGANVASVTYYESHGPFGLLDGDNVFPVYEALLRLGS